LRLRGRLWRRLCLAACGPRRAACRGRGSYGALIAMVSLGGQHSPEWNAWSRGRRVAFRPRFWEWASATGTAGRLLAAEHVGARMALFHQNRRHVLIRHGPKRRQRAAACRSRSPKVDPAHGGRRTTADGCVGRPTTARRGCPGGEPRCAALIPRSTERAGRTSSSRRWFCLPARDLLTPPLSDICRAAGISTGALFHYFPSKQAVFYGIGGSIGLSGTRCSRPRRPIRIRGRR
jgi:Bacterial regulatory proteins, tetR family